MKNIRSKVVRESLLDYNALAKSLQENTEGAVKNLLSETVRDTYAKLLSEDFTEDEVDDEDNVNGEVEDTAGKDSDMLYCSACSTAAAGNRNSRYISGARTMEKSQRPKRQEHRCGAVFRACRAVGRDVAGLDNCLCGGFFRTVVASGEQHDRRIPGTE